ncbi:2-oxoglutarate dehydrogenase, E2 component, dihydrolipoamide succinyltransferase [Arsenicicoccus dermatophilus]|uniref:2-oxoglutarate dehydrogenase, E2 component, dihydrolipoamide succinyltransferase n=1 Tax=Arsenicicoccus dermatophilus TaxID=1076331 RepID=UPI001F4D0529|nr:2-oxoglutarate dehydrogenase, E2 component, dihydrolipoamide succinyltransferase [Arsenicicoccus dermatophilus]MCH8612720.1 2-oxoglutarate dehydrogenase, E2 component, dihydrolipoamide succinyltransferase [Arsenicicoccus dermatophilus]
MSERVTMPALGESVTEGTVTRWLKSVGDTIEVDEPLLEVSTDKVDTEIPSPVAGTLQEILVEEDETVPVGADLAVIGDGDAPAQGDSDGSVAEAAKETEGAVQETEETVEETTSATPSDERDEPVQAEGSGSQAGSGSVSGGETVTMPALGESVTEGTVTRWLKAEGDEVAVDEPLLEVSTDKVDTEIPSPFAGTLTTILVQEDETAAVGANLAVIGGEASGGQEKASEQGAAAAPDEPQGESPAETTKAEQPPAEAPQTEAPKAQEAKKQAPAAPQATAGDDAAAYVTPLVRKLAADNGVDLASVTGTGVGGRIRKQDVLDAAKKAAEPTPAQASASPAAAPAGAPAPSEAPSKVPAPDAAAAAKRGTTEKMPRLRKVIAQRMVESLATSAQLTAVVEVDMTRVVALRARAKDEFLQREGTKLTYLPFITLATIEALKAFPQLNSSIDGDSIVYHGAEHMGIAVDTDRGLLVPVVKDAGDLNIAGLSRKIADLADRTRTNKVGPDELGGATFTITNIGSNGSLMDTPIINQPNVGILGTGAIVKRPAVITDAEGNDAIAIRSMCYLVLTYDHRAVDGALAGKFLSAIKARLEEGRFQASLGL